MSRFIRVTDWPGLVLLAAAFLLAGDLYPERPLPKGFASMLRTRTFLAWMCACLAGHALYLNFQRQPMPAPEVRKVYSIFGRNIMLTRHCVVIQFVHLLLSAIAETSALVRQKDSPVWLLNTCYGNALFVGALASFVTVQYYKLVRPDPEFLEDCESWARRGVPQKWIQDLMHTWALPLTFVDLIFVKQRGMLVSVMPHAMWVAVGIACFAAYYMVLIHFNHWATGSWPYGILEKVDEKGFRGWLSFWVLQTSILVSFMLVALAPVHVLPEIF